MASKYDHLINIIFASKNAEVTKEQIKKIFDELYNGDKKTKAATQSMSDFEKALRRAAIVAPVWMILRNAMMGVMTLIKEQATFLVDLESAMARIQIVGKGTAEEMNGLKESLVALSYAYGVSASQALEAAKTFAQQGRTVKETLILTRAAMIGAQVLGIDIKTTVDNLTAAVEGFQIPVSNSIDIVNKWINVEKEFAVTAQDLANATKVSGASANQLGITMAQFLGDVTAVVEVTRKTGDEAARGLSFIYARLLTTAKPVIEQIAQIKFHLDEQGQATNALTSQTRPLADILEELAGKWNTLTTEEKLQIATSLGSKRQMTIVNSLMQNYNRSLDARIVALTSAGSAEKAFLIIQDTVEKKTERLKSAWNNLTFALADTSAWKGILDVLNQTIIAYTMAINSEKGLRAVYAQQSMGILANIETRQSQVAAIEELIQAQQKLKSAPVTEENEKRLTAINKALDIATQSNPTIQIAIAKNNQQLLHDEITNIVDNLEKQKIETTIGLEFQPKLIHLEEIRKELLKESTVFKVDSKGVNINQKIAEIDKQILDLHTKLSQETEKQFNIYKGQKEAKQAIMDISDEEVSASAELTDAEKERLEIDRQVSNFRIIESGNLEQQIQYEIELVKNSKNLYDQHQKALELEKLNNQLLDARLKKREDELKTLGNIAIQFEKADMFEKNQLRRAAELTTMPIEDILSAFENDTYDKEIILDYWTYFSDEAQKALSELAISLNDLPTLNINTDEAQINDLTNRLQGLGNMGVGIQPTTNIPTGVGTQPITNNIVNKGAEQILVEINTPNVSSEEIINKVKEQIESTLLKDKNFQRVFGQKIFEEVDTE